MSHALTRANLRYVAGGGVATAHNILSHGRRSLGPLRNLLEAYRAEGPAPDVLLLGDSVMSSVSREDSNRRPLADMLCERLHPLSVCAVHAPAFHCGIFLSLLSALSRCEQHPRLVVLPINLRSFSPQWALNPKWQCGDLSAAIDRYLSFPTVEIGSRRYKDGAIRRCRYLLTRVEFPNRPGVRVSDINSIIRSRPVSYEGRKARLQTIFEFHYMFSLDEDHFRLTELRDLLDQATELRSELLAYVVPLNTQAGSELFGPGFADVIADHVGRIAYVLGQRDGAPGIAFADFSALLSSRQFFHAYEATEHLNESGREVLSKEVAHRILAIVGNGERTSPI